MSSEPVAGIFIAETGVDVPSVSADQMRELDRIAIEETGPSLLQMMENAGRNLALLAMELMGPHWRKATVLILAGNGGNGGGGICAARHLSNHGVTVDLCLAAPESLSDAALAQRSIFRFTKGREVTRGELDSLKPDLIIDSLIGYGLRARPHGTVEELVIWSNRSRIPVLTLDVPSGIDATSGDAPGESIRPTWTMALALPKSGLHAQNTGQLFLADIGIPIAALRRVTPDYTPPFGKRSWIGLKVGRTAIPA